MKKDIYVIRNYTNDMCYVGQSVDYKTRFRKHKEEAIRNSFNYKSPLYKAMNDIGTDKFYVEVLERQVENYDEREKFWIEELNTIWPNGYNLTHGGMRYPNLSGILHHDAKISSEEMLMSVYEKLLNTNRSLTDIASDYGVSYNVIRGINQGETYVLPGYKYPLREFVLNKGMLDRLTFDLKYSTQTYDELAVMYGISKNQVKAINYGNSQYRDYIEYPIRKICYSSKREHGSVAMIQKDLISSDMSFDEIAVKYGCSKGTVRRINNGDVHKNDEYHYPLRRSKFTLSQKALNEIYKRLLYSDDSINTIAESFSVSSATIKRINNGSTKKYRDERYTYPLRPM